MRKLIVSLFFFPFCGLMLFSQDIKENTNSHITLEPSGLEFDCENNADVSSYKLTVYELADAEQKLFSVEIKAKNDKTAAAKITTTANIGFSGQGVINDKTYYMRQSIGQSSVIGSYRAGSRMAHQGFIHPFYKKSIYPNKTFKLLDAGIFPNPFINELHLVLNEKIKEELHLSIYDMKGNKRYASKSAHIQNLTFNLSGLPPGAYILTISSNEKHNTFKIIKTQRQ